jgi:hypothetical protein
MLEAEEDEELRTFIASELCDLCTMEGLDRIRGMVLKEEYDPQTADLDRMLLTVATMTGYTFPEQAETRERVDRRTREWERRRKWDDPDPFIREMRERWLRGEPRWAKSQVDDSPPPGGGAAADWVGDGFVPPPAAGTYRREEPKVGRNDPCPCGSGKKYKKCCLQLERA